MSDPDPTIPNAKPSSGGAEFSPLGQNEIDLTDTQMQEALAPGTRSAAPTVLRGWQAPTVEELQRVLPQYEVQQFLARGGMGAVYKGTQRSLDRCVAIKILPPGIEDEDVHYGERFKQEARAMAKFKHPGIVAVYDAGETPDGLLYFIMEFIEGTDVAQLVAAQGRLPVAQALSITTHICDALAYAHSRGVVHRDIKPANIMLEADGAVKVADFGLAKVVAQESAALTRSDMSLGTPDFIAPESMLPGLKVDARADLYAVGVMLYQMLTGRIPRGRFQLPSGVRPEIDPRLDAIVDKAMQPDREQRYASATELKADLERVMQSGAHPPVRDEPAAGKAATRAKAGRSYRTPLIIAVLTIACAAGGLFIWKGGSSRANNPAKAQASPDTSTADGRVIDLLALVDVKRDAIAGAWSRTVDGLVVQRSPDTTIGRGRLQLPFEAPAEYDFDIEFTPGDGGGYLGQALSGAGHPFAWIMDQRVSIGTKAGFEMLHGKPLWDNSDASVLRKQLLTNSQRHVSHVEVRRGKALGFLDGEKLVQWGSGSSDFKQFDMTPDSAMRDARHLGIIASDRAVMFHKITVREIRGPGFQIPAAAP